MIAAFLHRFFPLTIPRLHLFPLRRGDHLLDFFVIAFNRRIHFFHAAILNRPHILDSLAEDRFNLLNLFRSELQALFHPVENVIGEILSVTGWRRRLRRFPGGANARASKKACDHPREEDQRNVKPYLRLIH